jgi:hypothetical protein
MSVTVCDVSMVISVTSVRAGGVSGCNFLPLYTSKLLSDRVSQNVSDGFRLYVAHGLWRFWMVRRSRSVMFFDLMWVTICDGFRCYVGHGLWRFSMICRLRSVWIFDGVSVTLCDGFRCYVGHGLWRFSMLCRSRSVGGGGGEWVQISTLIHFNTPFRSCFTKA